MGKYRGKVSRSTLADANETRHGRIQCKFAQALTPRRRCAARLPDGQEEPLAIDLDSTAYALDSTTIEPLPVAVSLGVVSGYQGRDQAAHAAR